MKKGLARICRLLDSPRTRESHGRAPAGAVGCGSGMKSQLFSKAWSNMEGLWRRGPIDAQVFYPTETVKPIPDPIPKILPTQSRAASSTLWPCISWFFWLQRADWPDFHFVSSAYLCRAGTPTLPKLPAAKCRMNKPLIFAALCQANLGPSSSGPSECNTRRCLTLVKP